MSTQLLSLLSLISLLLLLHLVPSSSKGVEGNFLLTNRKLFPKDRLYYKNYTFVFQEDCNLVLYNGGEGFQSNSVNIGKNCECTLNDRGQLLVKNSLGITRWDTPGGSKRGNYAAVLGPDGQVSVYGPSTWSTTLPPSPSSTNAVEEDEPNSTPLVPNILFWNESLKAKSKLETVDYSLTVTDRCNAELRQQGREEPIWETETTDFSRDCFLKVNNRGVLVLKDRFDRSYQTVVWDSDEEEGEEGEDGDYVLLLQRNGQAAVYGPLVWSTAFNHSNN